MRRNLSPEQLGNLLELPLNAVVALHRADGSVLQAPVWHRWTGTHFVFYIPAGDRKQEMLRRDPRISLIVADSAHPFRTMQVEGTARVRSDGFRAIDRDIATGYVASHDPEAEIDDYIGPDDGVWVEVAADRLRACDYADEAHTRHTTHDGRGDRG
jgi:PPOX class probable F420-dependent enzyme